MPDRLAEAADGAFGAGVGGQRGQAVEDDGGADVDDRAGVARDHAAECGAGAVDGAHVGDVGDAAELVGRDVQEAAIDAVAGAVDPNGEGAELGFQRGRGGFEGGVVRHVGRGGGGVGAGGEEFVADGGEAGGAAGDEADAPAFAGKAQGGAAANAGGGAG